MGTAFTAERASSPIRSPEGRDMERRLVVGIGRPVRPTLGDDLGLGPEAHAFLPVLADVAESGTLPPAEAVVRYRHRNRHVDADHPDIDPGSELARGMAVASEDRDAIAIFVLRREPDRFFEITRPDDLQYRAENLVLIALHRRLHVVEQRRSDEEAFFM